MEFIAKSNSVRVSPRKARLIAKSLRTLQAMEALRVLSLTHKGASSAIAKTLKSAIANAKNKAKKEGENLIVKSIEVFEGPSLKRFWPSTRGRIHPYKKRSSHIKIVLEEVHGTKS